MAFWRGPPREGRIIFLIRRGLVMKAAVSTILAVAVVTSGRPSIAFQHMHRHSTRHNPRDTNNKFVRQKNPHRTFRDQSSRRIQQDCQYLPQQRKISTSTRLRGGGGGGVQASGEGAPTATDRSAAKTTEPATRVFRKRDKFRRRGMSVALGLSNFSVMGAKCALPSVLSLLLSQERGLTFLTATSKPFSSSLSPQNQFAQLLGFSTLSVALGKLLLGPVIDNLGGIRALQATLVLLVSLLATITVTQRFWIFASCWVLVDFVFSSCWAACISGIQQSFPSAEWGRQIGHLATGARLGNAASFSLFAAILFALEDRMVQPWRVIFLVSTLLQLIPLCLLSYFGKMTLDANHSAVAGGANPDETNHPDHNKDESLTPKNLRAPRFRDSLAILKREATTPEFWLHLVSRSCLMVFASFLLFVPTLMNQVYDCSNAVAAQVASAYSLGCLLSVSLGSRLYAGLSTAKHRMFAIAGLLSLATTASLAQLAHSTGVATLSWTVSTMSMFLWGFAFSLPFYLPPSLYALARGGRECSASIADCFDFFGFSLLAWFNKYVASIGQHSDPSSWVGCFRLTTACSLVAMVAQSCAIWLEKKKEGPNNDASVAPAV